jgi:3-hydroxybutyryl-CoA dehydrogenase
MEDRIKNVIILGSGTMGNGISQAVATPGQYATYMLDIEQSILDRGMEAIRDSLRRIERKGRITPEEAEAILSRIKATTDYEVAREADIVIEAIPENLELKIEIFRKLDRICPPHTILGTNTSSLPITAIAASTARPEAVIGMHFMNPVSVMKGVEVIRGRMTSAQTIEKTLRFLESIDKIPCLAKDYAGFVNSRLLNLYMNEAVLAVMDGNSPEEVDRIMVHTANMPIGPLKLLDLVGIDVHLSVMEVLRNEFGDRFLVAPLTRQMVRAGHLGRKTGRGFYSY